MSIVDPSLSGTDSQFQQLDLTTAPVLKKRTSPVDRSMTDVQAASYQKGEISAPEQMIPVVPAPIPVQQAPIDPANAAIPVPQPVAPSTSAAAPTAPQAPQDDLVSRLWGARPALSATDQLLIETQQRLDRLLQAQQAAPAAPVAAPHQNYFGSDPVQQAPAAPAPQYVSRQEMQAMLDQQKQLVAGALQLHQAHLTSRAEAERAFPDVYRDSNLRQAADQIWASDRSLQANPNGPLLAAALARGLRGSQAAQTPLSAAAADARKMQQAGVGVSSPDGSGAPPPNQRYQAALARARATQDPTDFLQAMLIARGQM